MKAAPQDRASQLPPTGDLEGLRVLHVLPFTTMGGGAPRAMLTTVTELQARRPNVVFSLLRDDFAAEALKTGATVVTAFEDRLPKSSLPRFLRIVTALRRVIREQGITLLHSHSAPGVRYCWPAARLAGVPLVCHQRDSYQRNYFHAGLGLADHIIAISNYVRNTLPPALQGKTTCVLDAIPIPEVVPPPRPAGQRLRVGMLGRCVPEKGHDLALQAAIRLFEQPNVPPFDLELWGLTDSPFASALKATVAALPPALQQRIAISGYRLDTERFYQDVDIVLVPSRVREGLGLTAAEGLAWQRTVLVAGHGGLAEIVTHEETGLHFAPDSVESLAEALQRVLTDDALRIRLAEAGRKSVGRFAVRQHADKIDAVYAHILRQRRQRR